MNRLLRDEPVLQLLCAVPKCRRGFSLVRPQLLFATVFGVAAQQLQVVFVIFPVAQMSCVLFSDVGCYHFIGTYARLTFRVRAHNFSLRGSLGGDRLPTQAYAREVLCNF